MTKDEMSEWYQGLNGHKFEQTQELGKDQETSATVHGVAKSWTRLSD